MYICKAFIRKNTREFRNKLEKLGFTICPCCTFDGSVWLSNCIENNHNYIHGIGYLCEDYGIDTVEKSIGWFLQESSSNYIDCHEDEDLFIELISLRDDSDVNQLFIDDQGNYLRSNCETQVFNIVSGGNWRKCTIEDILSYYGRR